MGKTYQVMVHGVKDEKMIIDLCNTDEQFKSMTVLQLKEKIGERMPRTTGPETLRLIFTDKPLEEDSSKLSDFGIQHMSVILMVVRLPGGLTA